MTGSMIGWILAGLLALCMLGLTAFLLEMDKELREVKQRAQDGLNRAKSAESYADTIRIRINEVEGRMLQQTKAGEKKEKDLRQKLEGLEKTAGKISEIEGHIDTLEAELGRLSDRVEEVKALIPEDVKEQRLRREVLLEQLNDELEQRVQAEKEWNGMVNSILGYNVGVAKAAGVKNSDD